ncbi:MAG: enoyl-CoA hydratase/isomerase family protein [Thermoflexaceae bacterium]|nr:enoyl-CoA hydratase/isomerase family protein [Thermoflexaceae bacterium]
METLLVEHDRDLPGLVTITLNRPEKLNAISFKMHDELQEACYTLQRDASARVIIMTGAGRAFSAGADRGAFKKAADQLLSLPSAPGASPLEDRLWAGTGTRTTAALEALDQVTIGAINGLAVGGALAFAACLDLRIAGESAWFSIPEIDLNIPLSWAALSRLMREVGPARTKELVMTCDRFSSADALRFGLLNQVVPDAEVLPAARALAAKLLAKDPLAIAMTKSTTRALANAMVPDYVNHSDADYLLAARALARGRDAAGT